MLPKVLLIDLLRHGETMVSNKFIGSSDVLLSHQGRKQMQHATRSKNNYQYVISSPLRRCLNYAELFSAENNIPLKVEKSLSEYHFGAWENQSSEDIWQENAAVLELFWQDPENHPPPDAEKLSDFRRRIHNAMQHIIDNQEGDILLIVHGGVIRCILAELLQIPTNMMSRLKIDHASLSRIVIHVDSGKIYPTINFINKI